MLFSFFSPHLWPDNSPPNITLAMDENVEDDGKTLLARVNFTSSFTFEASDPDGDDVKFSRETKNSIPGITIDSGLISIMLT